MGKGTPLYGDRAPTIGQYVVIAVSSLLDNERVLTGTSNQIVVTDNGAGSTVVLSTPQDIHTGASPTFAGATLGGDTNRSLFAADGEHTMEGTARVNNHIRVGAHQWKIGATAPTAAYIGIYPTLAFDAANDDEVHYNLIIPHRMAAGTDIVVVADWAYDGGQDNGTVCWALEYKTIEPGEALAAGTTTISETSAGTHTTGVLVRTTFTSKITGCVAHDNLGLRLYRDVSEDTLGTDAELVAAHFAFVRDKHGEAT